MHGGENLIKDKRVVFMFSGQGSQHINMGRSLYKKNVRFKYYIDLLDEYFYLESDCSIIKELFEKRLPRYRIRARPVGTQFPQGSTVEHWNVKKIAGSRRTG